VLIGLLMLFAPCAIFVLSLPMSKRLDPRLCKVYRYAGGALVIVGSAVSTYFAFHGGDQGGIAAFFFQMTVILAYAALSISLLILNALLRKRDSKPSGNQQ
jgi:Na+/melibiose symporter-like transporter